MAGEDAKLLETLSRYKSEGDLAKAFVEQRRKLSERPSVLATLPEDATPEQVAEFREAKGVPKEGTLDAYKVKPPEGYNLSDGEKEVLAAYVQDMHEGHASPGEVQKNLNHYFTAQAAAQQALMSVAIEKQADWTQELKKELGRDYDATMAAGNAYLDQVFDGNGEAKTELLRAALPGGGFLGDHPQFIRMVADLALQNGYTDRIEANTYESGGKSLGEQQDEIESLRTTNPERYNDPQTQQKLDKLIGLRLSRGEIDEMGNPVRQRR